LSPGLLPDTFSLCKEERYSLRSAEQIGKNERANEKIKSVKTIKQIFAFFMFCLTEDDFTYSNYHFLLIFYISSNKIEIWRKN